MKRKFGVFDHFKNFVAMFHYLFHATIMVIHGDNGIEYASQSFSTFCHVHSIEQHHIATLIRSLLHTAGLLNENLWKTKLIKQHNTCI